MAASENSQVTQAIDGKIPVQSGASKGNQQQQVLQRPQQSGSDQRASATSEITI